MPAKTLKDKLFVTIEAHRRSAERTAEIASFDVITKLARCHPSDSVLGFVVTADNITKRYNAAVDECHKAYDALVTL